MTHFLTKEGERYGDFLLVKRLFIGELQMTLHELVHVPTGAQVMHLENDDSENLFCLSFKTLPSNSRGAPHILEHTVLCGSRLFPVKDPFFAMNRRSLNTFMNALTGSDFTCYPAATQVEKDFYNLLEVYLDAVFHPLLKEESFLQEGHRFEFAVKDDPKSPLEVKGIVYNEMKGSVSSVSSHIWHKLIAHLVPDLPYAYNSGGDPKDILELSYRELIEFYDTYYHPSRCLFFFYGNLPLQKHLDFILERALKNIRALPPLPSIALQKRFAAPRSFELPYPLSESEALESQCIHVFGWLTAAVIDQADVLALVVLDSVLMDTDASILRKALLASELCVQADSYIDTEMSEVPFVLFCRGCKEDSGEALKKVLFETLEKVHKEGIDFSLVEASIHQLELSRLEIGGDRSPFGLTLFMRAALGSQHGCAPEEALIVHSLFSSLLEKVRDPHFFKALIEKYFLKNSHFVSIAFTPDPKFTSKEVEAEEKYLSKIKKSLTDRDLVKILEQTKTLEEYQRQIEGQKIDCLPKVTLADVRKEAKTFPLNVSTSGKLEIYHCPVFTNQIVYADLVFDLPEIEEEELFALQLFVLFFAEVGCGKRNYKQNLEAIHAHTGGIGAYCSLNIQASDSHLLRPSLQIRGKALGRKLSPFFELFKEMATVPRFDEKKRLGELIQKLASSLQNQLTNSAMRYALGLASSSLSSPGYIHELWYGLTFYQKVQKLKKELTKELPQLMETFEKLKGKLLSMKGPHLVLSCDGALFSQIEQNQYFGLNELASLSQTPWKGECTARETPSQARAISSPVAFNAYGLKTVGYAHSDAPALLVSTLLFENKILHHRIRERGGAYGAGASYNFMLGHYSFHSYRDPHIAATFHTFQNAIDEMASGDFSETDLEEAKLGIIQQIDQPTSPGSRGIVAYTWLREGKTLAMRQHFRDRILSLSLSKELLQRALQQHLQPYKDQGTAVVFAGEELIEKEKPLLAESGKVLPIFPI